ncbi:hypothetical protein ACNHKA_06760 [Klebsiella michiganensis]
MNEFSANGVYRDVKRILKRSLQIGLILIALIILGIIAYLSIDHFRTKSRESALLEKALPFTSSHTPWVYTRDDFGTESKLELWILDDTDTHAIIRVNGKYSVYSTSTDASGSISFYGQAGDACGYASAYLTQGEIAGVQCDSKSYTGGPWNKFR